MTTLMHYLSGELSVSARIISALLPAALILGYLLLGLAIYAVRSALRGQHHDPELATRGSSVLLGMWIRHYFAWVTQPVLSALRRLGLPADALTTLSVLLVTGAAVAAGAGRFALGGWLYIFGGLCDFLDGRVARASGSASKAGAALDSVLDRYSDGVFLVGLAWYYRDTWVLPVIGALMIGTFMISYIRAKAESLGVEMKLVGMMQRPERVVYLGFAVALAPVPAALYVPTAPAPMHYLAVLVICLLAASTLLTSARRLIHLLRALGSRGVRGWGGVDRGGLLRFSISSTVATGLDFLVVVLLVRGEHVTPWAATFIGCAVGALVNFTINRVWAFGVRSPVLGQMWRYGFVSGSSALLNAGGVAVLLLLPSLDYRLAWLIARGAVFLLWNYPLNRGYVFAEPEGASEPRGEADEAAPDAGAEEGAAARSALP